MARIAKGADFVTVQQSRVGIGSTTPEGILTVNRRSQTILATDVIGDNSIDRYSLYVTSAEISNQKGGQNLTAPSIFLQSGSIRTSSNQTGQSARILITGGQDINGNATNGVINFYTAMSSSPTVTIGTSSAVGGAMTYFGYNSSYLSTSSMNISSYAIYALGNVLSTGSFIVTSDQRIKKNIVQVGGEQSLELLERIHIYEYEMRDRARDPGRKIGVIAQQIREVLPEAVKVGEDDYVADLLAYVKLVYNDQTECIIQLFDEIELSGDIRLINEVGEKVDVKIVKKISNTLYKISVLIDTEKQWMVYGTLQKNILAVDKPMLGMLAISAIQQLSKEMKEMRSEIKKLWEVIQR
jgi:hypothetical protein